ncbi:endonuclease III [Sporanaerobium hydrogeniformans]|uniref:Endonuclease III n=1 Tax=Sporanaerobium hydrogeniformans TaxID=3072179 RepID=A0AC61DCN9_9FIRM|nr:endonuclease III [Sporanaerobium hydrogeniformans]PHV70670.1 endonuclease III [Sporanaerobium hydrogeniformans]
MKQSEQIKGLLTTLDTFYPKEVICYLHHETPWQLLIATILSAQCTDDRVNMVTPALFKKYPSVEAFAKADLTELEEAIRSTGFYKNKAKNILACTQKLMTEFGGEVPSDIDALVTLAGVGRKTANVVRGNIFKIPSIVVDTHVKRITIRWGLTLSEDPVQIEKDLMQLLPKEHWIRYNTQVIAHGRAICTARHPKCTQCMFLTLCPFGLRNILEKLPFETQVAFEKGHMY